MQRIGLAATGINLVLLILVCTQSARMTAQSVAPVLRGSAFELVDERGTVRSRLNVEASGEVVFRLLDQQGTIRVKLAAGEDGSGLVLLDEATEVGVHIMARRAGNAERPTTTSITLKGANGPAKVIAP